MALTTINSGGVKDDSIVNADIKSDAAISLSKLASTPAVLTGSTNNTITTVTAANAIQGEANLTFDGTSLKLGQTQSKINLNTSDASDNKYLSIHGGGDSSQTRGAGITFYGNEVGTNEGRLWIGAGNSGSANGFISFNTGGSERARITHDGHFTMSNDSSKLKLGASNDLQLFHDGSKSYLVNSTGNLELQNGSNDIGLKADSFSVKNGADNETMLTATADGAVELYHNNVKKLETVASGVVVTGNLLPDALYLADNEKAYFGSGDDLEIYHDGNSHIHTTSGYLKLDADGSNMYLDANEVRMRSGDGGEIMAKFIDDGACELYYNNVKKFETKSAGVTVSGEDLTIVNTANAGDASLYLTAGEAGSAQVVLYADEGDNATDKFRILVPDSDGIQIQNFSNGSSWENYFKGEGDGVYIYYNNVAVLRTIQQGIKMHNGGSTQIWFSDVNTETIRMYTNASDLRWYADVDDDAIAELQQDGDFIIDGSFSTSGVDYAEYFESTDGSAIPLGTTVVLENGKIRAATSSETPIGVIRPKTSGTSVTGGDHSLNWQGKYLVDDYDGHVLENGIHCTWTDSDGNHQQCWKDRVPTGVTIPEDAEETTIERRKLNPDFDESKTYVPRTERAEWNCVGLLGQIPITKGQPTSSNWIKMKDRTSTVELWMVK